MGQYFLIVNKTKREYISPHELDGGLKLPEVALGKTGRALMYLLADNGDDVYPFSDILGRWVGDEVVVAGEYGKDLRPASEQWPGERPYTLYHKARREFTDISDKCIWEE